MARALRPAALVVATLVGGVAGGAPAGEELPLERIKLPAGFHIAVYAHPVKNARSLALGPDGLVFVGTRAGGEVFALVPDAERQRASRVVTLARGLQNPNGVAFRDGALWVAERSRILRFDDIVHHLDAPPKPVVVRADYPSKAHHGWKFIAFGPDGWLYVPVGAPCNVCKSRDEIFATITRLSPDGKTREIFARGVRNTVGFDWHPKTRELWFTDNGRDELGDNQPPDELNRAPRAGMDFGFPYCHGRDIPDPKYGRERPCSASTPPVVDLAPHVAALGMRFYTGTMFPDEYRGNVFIAEHGSWNRTVPIGYRVVRVQVNGDRAGPEQVFAEGWLPPAPRAENPNQPSTLRADESADVVKTALGAKRAQAWGRPVDVLVMPDGALLVSDDAADAVYRISYAAPRP